MLLYRCYNQVVHIKEQDINSSGFLLLFSHCVQLFCNLDYKPPGSSVHGISQARIKNTRVGCHILLPGIFRTQGPNGISCIGSQLLYHWTAREALNSFLTVWNCCQPSQVILQPASFSLVLLIPTKGDWGGFRSKGQV